MRLTLKFFLLVVLWCLLVPTCVACRQEDTLTTSKCNIELDLRERIGIQGYVSLGEAVEYHGRYFCFFSYSSLYGKHGSFMDVVDVNGHAIEEIPDPIFVHYRDDLFVRNDTLFFHSYGSWNDNDFFFDTVNWKWVPCDKVDKLIAEDDDYLVFAMDKGEFGQTTWFVNRASGQEYVVWGIGDVRRVGETYFMVNTMSVTGVSLSRLANARPSPVRYREAVNSYSAIQDFAEVAIVADTFYRDPNYDGFHEFLGMRRDTLIVGSFVDKRGLLLLVQQQDSLRLMRLGDSTHLVSDAFVRLPMVDLHPFRFTPMCGDMQSDRILRTFQKNALNLGLIDIRDGRIFELNIHHIVDTIIGMESDRFDSLIDFLNVGWDNLDDNQILTYESRYGSSFIKRDSLRNGYFEDIGLTDSLCYAMRFLKRVDGMYNLATEYCLYKDNRRLAAVFFDFGPPQSYLSKCKKMGDERERWCERQAADLIALLDSLCGPHRHHKKEVVWHYRGIELHFFSSSNRLLVFKAR